MNYKQNNPIKIDSYPPTGTIQYTMPISPSRKLAMLIDGDNAKAELLGEILQEASKHGMIIIRRIYGNWTKPNMFQWSENANKHAFQTMHQLSYTTGKNATDAFMNVDAMDILYSGNVDGFIIVSSDSDFTYLAKRIREHGLLVIGMGGKHTPESFRNACEIFTFVENLSDSTIHETDETNMTQDTGLKQNGTETRQKQILDSPHWKVTVRKAIEMTETEGWVRLSDVGINIRKIDPSFDQRTYGHKNLSKLIMTAPDQFEIQREKNVDPSVWYVKVVE